MVSSRNIMVVRALLSCIVAFVVIQSVQGGIGEWKNYTDMKHVRSIASDGTTIWAGTSGGIFRFNPTDSSYQKFTNSEGLTTNDVTAIFVDPFGDVWIGEQNGSIDIYSPRNDSWRHISNIADDKTKTNRAINRLYLDGDRMYIAASFGLTVFSISKFEFSDTYLGFSSLQQPAVAASIVFQGRIFAATSGGIVASKVGAANLTDPQQWEITSAIATGNSFGVLSGVLFAGTGSGLFEYQNGTWTNIAGVTSSVKILTQTDTSILFVNNQQLRSVSSNSVITDVGVQSPFVISSGALLDSKDLFVGFNSNGIGTLEPNFQSWKSFSPNSPYSNLFSNIVFDDNNILWAASGRAFGGGFYSFDGSVWKNYNTGTSSLILTNDCFAIAIGPNNSKWVGTWGEGLLLINSQGNVIRRFDYYNTGFIGVIRNQVENKPSYTVPGSIAVDKAGAVWVTTYVSLDGNKVLWKMNPDSTWESFPGSPYGFPPSFMNHIVIDNNNTKWFINSLIGHNPTEENPEVVFYNEQKSIPKTSNGWGVLTANDGITNDKVYSIVVDKLGDLWLGTGEGISIVTNPSNPTERINRVFQQSVRDQSINCIAIDPLNNKWIGTSTGIYVLSPDGTLLLDQYSVENTNGKLVDNNILSIAFDRKRGIAYFGTEKGLSSLEIAAVTAKTSLSTIDLSPNPVYLSDHNMVEIRGLIEESTIKVLSIYGKVLKQFPAQGGGRAFWDCTDGEGNSVATGIYIIVAHDRTGSQVASAKVAVIRK